MVAALEKKQSTISSVRRRFRLLSREKRGAGVVQSSEPTFETTATSLDSRIWCAAQDIHFPQMRQSATTGKPSFYPEFLEYTTAIQDHGLFYARDQLRKLLTVQFETLEQEARRTPFTAQIPFHVTAGADGQFQYAAIGQHGDWLARNQQQVLQKPDSLETERFRFETQQTVGAYDLLHRSDKEELVQKLDPNGTQSVFEQENTKLHRLLLAWQNEEISQTVFEQHLQEDLGYVEKDLEIGIFMGLLFPELRARVGQTVTVLSSRYALHVFTQSPFHNHGESSFVYAKQLVFFPGIGMIALDQGLFSAFTDQDLEELLLFFVERSHLSMEQLVELLATGTDVMNLVLLLDPELSSLTVPALLGQFIDSYGLKRVSQASGFSSSSSQQYFDSYLQLLQGIFDHEVLLCQRNPELITSVQDRITSFSPIILHALAASQHLPVEALLNDYRQLFRDKKIAQKPERHQQKIVETASSSYSALRTIEVDLSGFDCIIGGIFGNNGLLSMSQIQSIHGMNAAALFEQVKQTGLSMNDFESFCKQFGLDPAIFDKKAPGGKCPWCGAKTPFISDCMCPVCAVELGVGEAINDHTDGNLNTICEEDSAQGKSNNAAVENESMGLSAFVASWAGEGMAA